MGSVTPYFAAGKALVDLRSRYTSLPADVAQISVGLLEGERPSRPAQPVF